MKLIIFEKGGIELLSPLTLLRASFELRCGHTSLAEKIIRNAGDVAEICYSVRDILAPTVRQRYPENTVNEVGMLDGDDLLLVDGRVLAVETLPITDGEGVVMYNDSPVIIKINASSAAKLSHESVESFIDAAVEALHAVDGDVEVIEYSWDLVLRNPEVITADFKAAGKSGLESEIHPLSCIYGPEELCYVGPNVNIHPTVVLDTKGGPITIEEGVTVFPHSRIEGPAYIGPHTQIVGGKIREGCSFGPHCRVGGEVEESIIHGYSNKYHDGFLGHVYVGEWVNLGALTTNSDLKNDYSAVEFKIGKKTYNTGSSKVGSIIGDHTKTSIGTLLNTGSNIGTMCLLMATGAPLPKYIPSFSWYLNGKFSRGAGFNNLLKTAHAAVSRRKRTLTDEDVELLKAVYEMTKEDRDPLVKRDSKALLRGR